MNIAEKQHQDVLVLVPEGRIDGATYDVLETKLVEHLDKPVKSLVIDFSHTKFISTIGLRVLLMAAKRAKAVDCHMALCGLSSNISEVFEVSGFSSLFNISVTQADAVTIVKRHN